jgi:sigma-B regulation protein RsbU (phosphoserine phosphatase)
MKIPALLLVDDEVEILNALRRNTRAWAAAHSLQVLAEESVEKALRKSRSGEYEIRVLVTDQRMPGRTGDELICQMKRENPDTVPIVLTGNTDPTDIEKLLNSDIFTYLLKPWDNERLISELEKAHRLYHSRRNEREARERIEQELRLGAEFQRALQQNIRIPSNAHINFAVSSVPASSLDFSGDYYDIIELPSDRYLLLVGDVAGHGLNSAFISGILKAIIFPEFIRPVLHQAFSPSRFLKKLNTRILDIMHNLPEVFITFSAALADLSEHSLTYASAGSPPAVILRSGEVLSLCFPTIPLGASEYFEPREQVLDLRPGDFVALYSDGLHPTGINSPSFTEEELFTLFNKIFSGKKQPGDDRAGHEELLRALREELGLPDFEDDITLVTARILT